MKREPERKEQECGGPRKEHQWEAATSPRAEDKAWGWEWGEGGLSYEPCRGGVRKEGFLMGTVGGEGFIQNPRTRLTQGGDGEGNPCSFFLLASDWIPVPSPGQIQQQAIWKCHLQGLAWGQKGSEWSGSGAETLQPLEQEEEKLLSIKRKNK